jgi:hypothetical protein
MKLKLASGGLFVFGLKLFMELRWLFGVLKEL